MLSLPTSGPWGAEPFSEHTGSWRQLALQIWAAHGRLSRKLARPLFQTNSFNFRGDLGLRPPTFPCALPSYRDRCDGSLYLAFALMVIQDRSYTSSARGSTLKRVQLSLLSLLLAVTVPQKLSTGVVGVWRGRGTQQDATPLAGPAPTCVFCPVEPVSVLPTSCRPDALLLNRRSLQGFSSSALRKRAFCSKNNKQKKNRDRGLPEV